jgi:hypothetical protein
MVRFLFALGATAIAAAPAAAATYSATLSKPLKQRIVARNISWSCGPAACQGATEDSRPAVLCEGLAKRGGRVTSFVVNGRAFGSADLDKCNSAARLAPSSAIATAR